MNSRRFRGRFRFGFVALCAVGCSAEQGQDGTGGTAAGAQGGSAAGVSGSSQAGNGGDSAGAGGTSSGRGGGGAGNGGSLAGGTGGGSSLAPLVPLVTGHVWGFVFTRPGSGNTCENPTIVVGAAATIDGHSGFLYSTYCDADQYLVVGSGDQLTSLPVVNGRVESASAYEFIHSPVRDGETWIGGGVTQTWRSVPVPLTTPAGTFDDCWERNAGNLSLFYCRGVGLTRVVNGSVNSEMNLLEKNF